MAIIKNQSYHGVLEDFRLIRELPAKVYFASLLEREERSKYEWEHSKFTKADFIRALESRHRVLSRSFPSIVVAFPNRTYVYKWGDPERKGENERCLYLHSMNPTKDIEKRNMTLPTGLPPIGGPIEIMVQGYEMRFRAESRTIEEYLVRFPQPGDIKTVKIRKPNMFRDALEGRV
jgi:hypothetical protein